MAISQSTRIEGPGINAIKFKAPNRYQAGKKVNHFLLTTHLKNKMTSSFPTVKVAIQLVSISGQVSGGHSQDHWSFRFFSFRGSLQRFY